MILRMMCSFAVLLSASCADVGPFGSPIGSEGDAGAVVPSPDADLGPPMPVSLGEISGRPYLLTANEQYLFWAVPARQTIERMAKDGEGDVSGTPAGNAPVMEIAAADAELFWIGDGAGLLASKDSDFGQPALELVPSIEEPWDLSVAGDSVFFGSYSTDSDPNLGSLQRVPRSGGAAEVVHDNQAATLATAASDTAIYWATFQEVHRAGLGNLASRKTLATEQGQVLFMAAWGERVCWTSQEQNAETDDIWCSFESTNQRIAEQQEGVSDLKIEEEHAYWTNHDAAGAGRLYRHRFRDSETVILVDSDEPILDIFTDGRHLFWTQVESRTSGTASLWKMRIE